MHRDTESPSTIQLPRPARSGVVSLEEALSQRRSTREFASGPLSERQLSQLLWAAQGATSSDGYRTAPSAGALYPLEIYVVLATGFYHYDPDRHRLDRISPEDLRPALYRAALERACQRAHGHAADTHQVNPSDFSRSEVKPRIQSHVQFPL